MIYDLHVHSFFSPDAVGHPRSCLKAAHKACVTHLAVADHDTTHHIEPFLAEANGCEVTIIPAIELSCAVKQMEIPEVHLLCYFPRTRNRPWQSESVASAVDEITNCREMQLVELLSRAGISPNWWQVARSELAEHGQIHPQAAPSTHLFKRHASIFKSHEWEKIKEVRAIAKAQNLPGIDQPIFPEATRIIGIMRDAGATVVLAHPGRYGLASDTLLSMISTLYSSGIQGIEAVYLPRFEETQTMLSIARDFDAIVTVGSDTHDLAQTASSREYADFLCQAGRYTTFPF